MARIRTIKPEFFTSLTIADLQLSARLTFIGLWTHVDDDGRAVDEPRLVRAAIWPLDDRTAADVETDLRALHDASLICRYEHAGRRYLAVTGWKEHQRIDKPKPSKFPAPEDGSPLPTSGTSSPPSGPTTCGNSEFSEESPTDPGLVRDESTTDPGRVPAGKEQGTGNREGNRERERERASAPPIPAPPAAEPEAKGSGTGSKSTAPAAETSRPNGRTSLCEIPEDFHLTDAMRRWAAKTVPGLDPDFETKQFISYWRAEGRRKKNWIDAWQKWMRDSAQRQSDRAPRAPLKAVSGGWTPWTNPTDPDALADYENGW